MNSPWRKSPLHSTGDASCASPVSVQRGVSPRAVKPRAQGPSRIPAALLALLLAAGTVAGGAGPATAAGQDSAALQGDADAGAQLFRDYTCYGCHGYTGETGRGPRLNPPRLRREQFIAYLRNPPNPRRMPPYQQAEVSDRKLADIYAYLLSLPSTSPEAEDIPVLGDILRETPR